VNFLTAISVDFTQAMYSNEEANGTIAITVEADGYSIWPFAVEIFPMEIGGLCKLLTWYKVH